MSMAAISTPNRYIRLGITKKIAMPISLSGIVIYWSIDVRKSRRESNVTTHSDKSSDLGGTGEDIQ